MIMIKCNDYCMKQSDHAGRYKS